MKDQFAEDLQQAKATSKARARRIKEIVRSAAAQAMTEVKAGSGEVRSIAQNRFQTVIETAHDNLDRQADATPVNSQTVTVDTTASAITAEATPVEKTPVSIKTLLVKLFTVAKAKLFAQLRQEYSDLPRQYDDLKQRTTQQATQLDDRLNERYGDRYQQLKQRFHKAKVWYYQKRSEGATLETNFVEQKQAEYATKAGDAGTTMAQKEQRVRQQVKDFLQTAANKL